ncbi:hypothetical protein [Clostridium sp. BNL1100]|uniref:hypothetical protein n=1 Tax=Clostridium sp. BNL1100 TaxID=755731 RepID=UPI0002F519A2|nr:hypothetical protein [Clostridium sp. BNL1100]
MSRKEKKQATRQLINTKAITEYSLSTYGQRPRTSETPCCLMCFPTWPMSF